MEIETSSCCLERRTPATNLTFRFEKFIHKNKIKFLISGFYRRKTEKPNHVLSFVCLKSSSPRCPLRSDLIEDVYLALSHGFRLSLLHWISLYVVCMCMSSCLKNNEIKKKITTTRSVAQGPGRPATGPQSPKRAPVWRSSPCASAPCDGRYASSV